MRFLNYNGNYLYYENVNLNDVVKKYQTPIYIYSKAKILENYHEYYDAFKASSLKNYKIYFAMKANNNLSILKLLLKQNCGIDAVSIGEIQKAKLAGFNYKDIVFSGVAKSKDDLIFSIKNKLGQINVESREEITTLIEVANKLKKKANISLRINPDIVAHTNAKISTGSKLNKFGIDAKKIDEAIALIRTCEYLNLNGLSIHIGSQLVELRDFDDAFLFISKIYKKYPEFTTVDLGGGLGIKYNSENVISKSSYIGLIAKYFSKFKGKILIEPGRSIVADAGIFLTKIIRIKHTEYMNFIIVDGGMNNLIRPAFYGAWHEPKLIKKNISDAKNSYIYDIVGPICESSDVFCKNITFEGMLPEEGNYIAFLNAGAYGKSMASNYNLHDIAGELLIDDDKIIEISKPIKWYDFVKLERYFN